MPLSPRDLERLSKQGHDPAEFSVEEDGLLFLANVEGRCFFLDTGGRCVAYPHRPDGCRLYPLTLDGDLSNFVLDDLCPHRGSVVPSEEHEKALMDLLDRIGVARRNP